MRNTTLKGDEHVQGKYDVEESVDFSIIFFLTDIYITKAGRKLQQKKGGMTPSSIYLQKLTDF